MTQGVARALREGWAPYITTCDAWCSPGTAPVWFAYNEGARLTPERTRTLTKGG